MTQDSGVDLMAIDDVNTALEHYGIPGMKWGVRKKEERSSRERAVLDKLGLSQKDSARLRAKYGPETGDEKPKKGLTTKQKWLIAGGAAATIAVGATVVTAVLLKKRSAKGLPAALTEFEEFADTAKNALSESGVGMDSDNFKTFWDTYQESSLDRVLEDLNVDALDANDLDFSVGSIFKRISTKAEDSVRPGGFYAAFKPEDVERYKAALPVFWKQWGYDAEAGHIVNLKNKAPVKVASARKAYDLFRAALDEDFQGKPLAEQWAHLTEVSDRDALAKRIFNTFSAAWTQNDSPIVSAFFNKLKDAGYNAVVDINDMGALSETPIRFLDGTIFAVDSVQALSKSAIQLAQEAVLALKHAATTLFNWLTGKES